VSQIVIIGVVVILVVVILLLPLIFRKKPSVLEGPDLAELKYTQVSFKNGALTLSGMLFLPEGNGPFPVAVVIHGSGTSRRNSPWYLTVAQHLQENGIAVLLPDKRGSEKSEGDWRKATFYDLADDAISAIDFIRDQKIFEYSTIGVIGFSQGGWIAPIAAGEAKRLAFIVSMSGAGVTTDEQLLYEEVNHVAKITYPFIARFIAPINLNFIKKAEWWKNIAGFDPLPHWQKINLPVFMAYGENDKNVPVSESVSRIQSLGKSNITIQVYPGVGHGIVDLATHRVREDYLRDLVDFIAGVKSPA
jgi:uncharacterized protein